jgi:RNA polymerase sigma factor (sigma-70 family)
LTTAYGGYAARSKIFQSFFAPAIGAEWKRKGLSRMGHDTLRTRRSLVDRLGNWRDQSSWQTFYSSYWRLIYGAARKAGLTDAEAHDVVQETILTVAKKVNELNYDPAAGSFKGWLLNITRWRIADQFRKRSPASATNSARPFTQQRRTATIDRIPADVSAGWDAAWRQNLFQAALDRVKRKVDPKQYQIFDCYVIKEWPASKVASELQVNIGQVYLIRHRISALLKKEIRTMEAI